MPEPRIACTLSTPEIRERRRELVDFLRHHCREVQALDAGYRLRFDAEPDAAVLGTLATFIQAERECCPFLTFQLTVTPARGPVWLELSGPTGTREFLDTELGLAAVHTDPGAGSMPR